MELTKHWAAQLDDYAIDLAWAPGGGLLAAASAAGPISIFAGTDGRKGCELPGHEGGTNCLGFGPEGSVLASGGQDGAVKFWDAGRGQHVATAALGTAWVEQMEWSPGMAKRLEVKSLHLGARGDDTPLLAAAAGRKVALIRADGSVAAALPDAPKTISALAWCPVRPVLAAASFGSVRLWDASGHGLAKEYPYANGIHALAWSPDGKWLVSGNQDPSVHLWRTADETELQMTGYEGKVRYLSFDRSGRWLATSGGSDACLWDCAGENGPEGREPGMLPHEGPITALRFQNGHGLLAAGSKDGSVHLWSPERQQPLRASLKLPGVPTRLTWSPDDQFLAIGSDKGAVYVLKIQN